MMSVRFQGKPFNITVIQVIQVYAPTRPEAEWFYEDLQDLLELTLKKDVPFHYRDRNAKSELEMRGSVTRGWWLGGKLGLQASSGGEGIFGGPPLQPGGKHH